MNRTLRLKGKMDQEVWQTYRLMLMWAGEVMEVTQLNRTTFLRISSTEGVDKVYLNNGSWYI